MNKIAPQALLVNHMQESPLERGLCFTECKLMRSVRSHPRVWIGKSSGSPSHGGANTMPVLAGYGPASGKQADRRKERDGLPYKKSLEIGHFQVLRTRRRQSRHRSGAAGVARSRRDKGNGPNGGGWMYNRWWPRGQIENPGSRGYVRFTASSDGALTSRCLHGTVRTPGSSSSRSCAG